MNTEYTNEQSLSIILDALLNFEVKQIPSDIRFWMIRTKKGYFYNEFVSLNYVAAAWNTVTSETSFSEATLDTLNQRIKEDYSEIKRPTFVVNKCKSFIHDIKVGDILIIPSASSKFVTFAYAGEYYEDDTKTYELELDVISRIENKDINIDDVVCPYKKRRKIIPIRTISGESLNHHLFKSISSYHGITNLDSLGPIILDHLYNCYSYNDNTRLVFHVTKPGQITSKEFSGFLYSINSILSASGIDEMAISTQASVHSEGDIVFTIKEIYNLLSNNYLSLVAIAVVLGGGKFLTVELPGIPNVIKNILSIKTEHEKHKEELKGIKLDNMNKAIEFYDKLSKSGVSLETLENSVDILTNCRDTMQITPIETVPNVPVISSDTEETENEDVE